MDIIPIVIQASILAGYAFTAYYQSMRIKTLESNSKSIEANANSILELQKAQSNDLDYYKKLINLSDIEKNIALKLENQALEYKNSQDAQEKRILDAAIKHVNIYIKEQGPEIINQLLEFYYVVPNSIANQFPNKDQEKERNEYIKYHFPLNSKVIIEQANMIIHSLNKEPLDDNTQ